MENKSAIHFCQSSDLHPYECGGNCIHCRMEKNEKHNPAECWLCHDGEPPLTQNSNREEATPTKE